MVDGLERWTAKFRGENIGADGGGLHAAPHVIRRARRQETERARGSLCRPTELVAAYPRTTTRALGRPAKPHRRVARQPPPLDRPSAVERGRHDPRAPRGSVTPSTGAGRPWRSIPARGN